MKQSYQITRLPVLTNANLKEIMAERMPAVKNVHTVIPMLWQGLVELPLSVNGQSRTAKYYIPKDTPQGSTIVIMNVPEGEQTIPFLEKSGWISKADAEGICLFVLEPGDNCWGSPEEEYDYLLAGVHAEMLGQYILAAFAAYVVGYGAIGAQLHKVIMTDPLHIAAAVFLDAGYVDDTYRKEYEEKYYDIRDPYDAAAEGLRVPYRDVPVPVWIAADTMDLQTEAMLCYWKNAARAEDVQTDPIYGTVYTQSQDTIYTPQGKILKVAFQNQSYPYCCPETTHAVYSFLKQYYRYGMGPKSNMISKKVDYAAMGVEHRRFTDSNGIDREYLVYIPKAYRDGKKKLPMVIAYHGASQSMRNMMENGLWYDIADQEGLIAVYPESTLIPLLGELSRGLPFAYRPLWSALEESAKHTEEVYCEEMLDRVIAEFPVDESRIYVTGHSMGCMMTNYLGSAAVSHRFAAVGATSGVLRTREYTGTEPVPAFMTAGQFELWDYLLCNDGQVMDQIDMWLIRNGLASPENVHQVRTSGATEVYKENNYNNYVWKDSKGIPWVRYAWISEKHHVHTSDESWTFWKQWFSRWHIGQDGQRYYQ